MRLRLSGPNGQRPVVLFAPLMMIAAWLSLALGAGDPPVSLVWLPPSLMLVGLLTRGWTVMLPGLLGLAGWGVLAGLPWQSIGWLASATLLAPLPTMLVLRRLRAPGRMRSHLVQTGQILATLCLIQAPIAALLGWPATNPWVRVLGDWETLLLALATQSLSAVIFVRTALALMPGDGSGFCPVAGIAGGLPAMGLRQVGILVCLALASLLAVLSLMAGATIMVNLMSFVLFGCALFSAVSAGRRMSGMVTLAAALVIAALHVRAVPVTADAMHLVDTSLFAHLLLMGSILLLCLNAQSEERQLQARRLQTQAETNEVSDLPNLRAVHAMLQARCDEAVGGRGLLMAEIAVQDMTRWADMAGRTRLMAFERELGERLQAQFGQRALLVAHIGTGRYVLALPGSDGGSDLQTLIKSIVDSQPLQLDDTLLYTSCSVGLVDVADSCDLGLGPDSVLAAMSIAQQRASGVASRFHRLALTSELIGSHLDELTWSETVRQALRNGAFLLYAQPLAATGPDDRGMHFEILTRMIGPDGEVLAPARFLPALSKARLMERFDQMVIDKTLDYLHAHPDMLTATAACAINVSGPTICDPDFPAWLAERLAGSRVPPGKLVVEITESETILQPDIALRNVRLLQASGIVIAVDDFGTGVATFEYIRRYAPQWLKIDGSFVRAIDQNPLDKEIVMSIIRIANSIGARTVAEWVETDALESRIRDLGVDYLQGYAISHPVPIDELGAVYANVVRDHEPRHAVSSLPADC